MSKTESQSGKFLEELKANYRRRIQEVDTFSKHFSLASSDFRSQSLTSMLDVLHYYVDLQKKFTSGLPTWYDDNSMIRQSEMITESWLQTIRNLDLYYSQLVEYSIKNMRLYNQGWIQMMQTSERFYDMCENIPQIQRDTLIAKIKEAKELNETYLQKQAPAMKGETNTKVQKKQELPKKSE